MISTPLEGSPGEFLHNEVIYHLGLESVVLVRHVMEDTIDRIRESAIMTCITDHRNIGGILVC